MIEMATPRAVSHDQDDELLLQPGERRMVELVAMGVPDREIAQRTGLTEIQVRDQLLVIFKKLAVAGLLDQLLYVGDEA
jgi:DNA-binding NarL/FixJ family response regulator